MEHIAPSAAPFRLTYIWHCAYAVRLAELTCAALLDVNLLDLSVACVCMLQRQGHNHSCAFLQGKAEALGDVVRALKSTFDLQYVYVWHGLSAYWSGVSVDDEGVAKYNARIIFAEPTPGLKEIEPSMAWNPSVVSGIGVPQSAAVLYNDMHHYLSHAGPALPGLDWQV